MKVYKENGVTVIEINDSIDITHLQSIDKLIDNAYVDGYYEGIKDTINYDSNAYNEGFLNGVREAGVDV